MESKFNSILTTALFSLSVLWYNNASATDKTETLKGTITLGSTGYGIKLVDGKVIGFMGRGGNKVFAACHNGDRCEITGVVVYNIKNPIFLTVKSAHKLGGPSKTTTNDTATDTPPLLPDTAAQVTAPASPADTPAQVTAPAPAAATDNSAQPSTPAAQTDESDNSSPFLLDNNTNQ